MMRRNSLLYAIIKKMFPIPVLIGAVMLTVSCGAMYSDYFSNASPGPAPVVDGISPDTGQDPNLVPGITITGSNFEAGAVVRLTRAGQPGITASNVVVVSDTEIQCDIILPGAMYGPWNVTVTNWDTQSGVLENAFTVTWPDPTLSDITPNSGSEPNTVHITNLEGTHLMAGAVVRLIQGASVITATGVTAASPTRITCTFDLTGASSGAWDVELANPVGAPALLSGAFTVAWDAPTVTGITPNNGNDPGTIANARVAGTNFKPGATVRLTRAGYADIAATGVTFVNSTRIDCDIPLAGAMYGAWTVVVENADGQSAARVNAFTVNWPDVILSSITPNSGNEPDTVSVTLAGTHFMAGATVLLTDGITEIWATGVTVVDPTRIDCDIPLAGADYGAWDVIVTNPTGPSDTLPGEFLVSWDAPTVIGITPASGTEPNTIIITDLEGTNFKPGTAVRLTRAGYPDIDATSITVVSDTRITCRFPLAGAMYGAWNVVVTNADSQQGAMGGGFTINWPAPTLTSFSPVSSPADAVVAMSLTGTNFKSGATVRLVQSGQTDIIATGVTVVNATQITCQVDLTDAAYGDWDMVVANVDGQLATGATPFTVSWPAPTLSAATYDLWRCDTATITNLAGTGFKPGATVRLNRAGYADIPADAVTVVSDTQITCQFDLIAAAAGSWNIVVENADGQGATLANGVTFRDSFDEDWESGSDGWAFGTNECVIVTSPYHSANNSMSIYSYDDGVGFIFYDGISYTFAGGFQPSYIGIWIRKSDSANLPWINIGGDNTTATNGAIWLWWADFWANSYDGSYPPGLANAVNADHMYVMDSGNVNYGCPASAGAWHHVEFSNINFTTQRYDFRVNGALVAANVSFHSPAAYFTRLYISAGWYVTYTYVDDIEMY